MRILMFGWEFPPHVSGGLGTACLGITKALVALGHKISFVIPKWPGEALPSHVEMIASSAIAVRTQDIDAMDIFTGLQVSLINSALRPYLNTSQYEQQQHSDLPLNEKGWIEKEGSRLFGASGPYGPNLIAEVMRYARAAGVIAANQSFDVIHAHDWMTVFAGLYAKEASGKPLVLHIHSLEIDRSGENLNQDIFYLERCGMVLCDHVIAVSNYTKNLIIKHYGIDPDKISVVHNAVSRGEAPRVYHWEKNPDKKIVLFLGRITFQKGPDYFIEAAARVLKEFPEVTFVMAGAGDMMPRMIERVAELRIGKNFHFTGFLQGAEVERIFSMSDMYVMPSVSEPFGISSLEAMVYDVPVIISRQSGAAEILDHVLKVDFWDVDEIANKIIAILRYPSLAEEIVERSREQLLNVHWEKAAEKIVDVYRLATH
ncbi:MAG: glycosyltransferase family 4 protein [Syntrophales bacterium LBB04]|nr:glycosyltransferase family 4 protein [Syntrophales bacterium LBB04]